MFWCFHCYALNDHPSGRCGACGEDVEAPASLSWIDSLIWALRHPDGDRALVAAQTLGTLKAHESVPALRAAAEDGTDIYIRAEALRSLIAIKGAEALRPWLEALSRDSPFIMRDIACEALGVQRPGDEGGPMSAGAALLP